MFRGVLLGAVSGLSLSALVVGTLSLVGPVSGVDAHRPIAARPDAPVLRDQADAAPRIPDAMPSREAGPAVLQEFARGGTETPSVDRPVGEAAAAPPPVDGGQAVPLPVASAFNRPREDGEVVTPDAELASRPVLVRDGLRAAALAPRDRPAPQTQSAVRPPQARVAVLGAGPEAGRGPDLPQTAVDDAPRPLVEPPHRDMPRPAEETPVLVDTSADARPPAAPAAEPAGGETAEPARQAGEGIAPRPDLMKARPLVTRVEDSDRAIPPPVAAPDPGPDLAEAPNGTDLGTTPRRLIVDSAEEAGAARAVDADLSGALVRQAVSFDNPDDLPLLAIILIEEPESGPPRDRLAALGFPVTIAVDPTNADAAGAARAYRAAGHEVMMQASPLAPDGAPQEIGVAIAAARAALPQALGVLDVLDGAADGGVDGFAADRAALAALLPALAEAGMGFLAPSRGLNTAIATARREGVPAMPVLPALDAGGKQAATIRQALTLASLAAERDGAAIVVGHARPETLAAIESWRKDARSRNVVAAPISAVLTGFGR